MSLRLSGLRQRGQVGTIWEKVLAVGVSLTALLPTPGLGVFTGSLAAACLLLPMLYKVVELDRNLLRLFSCVFAIALLSPTAALLSSGTTGGSPDPDWVFRPISLMVSIIVLYWSSLKIGLVSAVILAIPAPLLFDVITRASQGNTWKYAASVWVSLGLLVLVHRMNVAMKVLAVGTIVIMSVLNDTRGIIAMAATGVLVEILSRTGRTRVYRIAASLIGASVLAVASYQLAIAGALGSGIQRTMILQTQEGPMSLLRTARPESGGNFALVLSDPFRFIIDDRVTADQAAVIQNSFSQVGRDPNSLYVQSGVLKSAELHSVTADLWLHLGFAGLLLSVIFGLFFAYLGFRALSSHRMLAGAVTFVSLRGVWDLLFSPVSDLRFWPLYFLVGLAFLASERKLRASTG